MSTVINIKNFDINRITTKDIATRTTGFKSIPVRYEGNVLRFQTPKMEQVFNVSEPLNTEGTNVLYGLDLSFRGEETDPKIKAFRETMGALDEFNLDYATKNSRELFGKTITREVVKEFQKPILKFSDKKMQSGAQYPPTMKTKLRFKMDRPGFEVYDKHKKLLDVYNDQGMPDLGMYQHGTKMINLLEYGGLWVVNKSFGATWRVVQTLLCSQTDPKGCFIMDSDDEDDHTAISGGSDEDF